MIDITTYNLDAIAYTPLYSPRSAYKVEIINSSAVAANLRADPADIATQITVLPGESKVFESNKNTIPFDPAQVILYGILASGTGTVKVLAH